MQAAGLQAWPARDPARERVYSFEQAESAELDPAERARFEAEPAAWRDFEAAPPGDRKTLLHWIVTAKQPETRARRLAELIRASAEQRRLRWEAEMGGSVMRWRRMLVAMVGLGLGLPAASVAAQPAECVILLHGLARSSASMRPMADALEAQGYRVANIDYPSREHPIEVLAPLAVGAGLAQCRAQSATVIHVVTHSLGGILLRADLRQHAIPELGRVVMLGPPNRGSEVVDQFAGVPGFEALNGPAGRQLGTGPESVPLRLGRVDFVLGVIAGTESINPILSTAFDGPNDGKVSVSRAKVAGMSDFIVLPVSHPFIMRDDTAIQQTLMFLRTGRFLSEAPEPVGESTASRPSPTDTAASWPHAAGGDAP